MSAASARQRRSFAGGRTRCILGRLPGTHAAPISGAAAPPGRERALHGKTKGAAVALVASVLLAQAAPVAPPAAGAGARVSSTLSNRLALRFTADGRVLREFERRVDESGGARIEVVTDLADGLDETERKGLETPGSPPPFVRVRYDKCKVQVVDLEGSTAADPPESEQHYFIERAAAGPLVRFLHVGGSKPKDEEAARVLADADAFVHGPRLAPFVVGHEFKDGDAVELPAAVLAPLLAQAVPDAILRPAQLTFHRRPDAPADAPLVFALAATLDWASPKTQSSIAVAATFELAGELVADRKSGQVTALQLEGPIRYGGTGDENGAKLEITGTGTLKFEYRADPIAAK